MLLKELKGIIRGKITIMYDMESYDQASNWIESKEYSELEKMYDEYGDEEVKKIYTDDGELIIELV